jgi:hypothetical protein
MDVCADWHVACWCVLYAFKDAGHLATGAALVVAATTVFLAYFMHGQYKVAKMLAIKYEHLKGLAGGGAENLISMLGGHDEFRKRVLERLAESFMSLDDVTGALDKLRTPAEDVARVAEAVAKGVAGGAKKSSE